MTGAERNIDPGDEATPRSPVAERMRAAGLVVSEAWQAGRSVAGPVSIGVLDADRALTFPDECPHCGRAAMTRVRVSKIFARRSASRVDWVHHHIDVRACDACARAHESAVRPNPASVHNARRRLARRASPTVIAGIAFVGCGLLLAGSGVRLATRGGSVFGNATLGPLVAGLVLACLGVALVAWLAQQVVILPADWPDAQYAVEVRGLWRRSAVIPAVATTLAHSVDFSDDRRGNDESSWRTYSFAREAYAQQFARLNADLLYDRARPCAPVRPVLWGSRALYYYVAGAALAAASLWSVLK